MFGSVRFDPVVNDLSLLKRDDEDVLIRVSQTHGLVREFAPVTSKGFVHYLGKVWRKIWRPCTHMEKVWMEMQKAGLKAVDSENAPERKIEKLVLLEENLRTFDSTVIKVHNENRKGLFKNARRVHIEAKQNAVYMEIEQLKRQYSKELNQVAGIKLVGPSENLDHVVQLLKDGDFKAAGQVIIPGFDFSKKSHLLRLENLLDQTEDEGWKKALRVLLLAHECGITGIVFREEGSLAIECPVDFLELSNENYMHFLQVEGNTGKYVFLFNSKVSEAQLMPANREQVGIKLVAEPKPVQKKLVTKLLPLLRSL